jgi:hypothetical protein
VDYFHIHSVNELAHFLSEDPRYRLVQRFERTLVFEELEDFRFLPAAGIRTSRTASSFAL